MPDATAPFVADFAADVRRDLALTPKQLQSKYLYDQLGSSLFEAICRLPWYRITRAESRLLARHAAEIVDEFCGGTIVELGCGSGEKIAMLAEALQSRGGSAHVHLIDISSQALEQTEQRLTRLEHVSVVGHQSTYEEGLAPGGRRAHHRRSRAGAAARVEHRQLRYPRGTGFPRPDPSHACVPAICCCSARTSQSPRRI